MNNQPVTPASFFDKERLYIIIFRSDTPAGKRFDVILLWVILFSVLLVILESVDFIREGNETLFLVLEWIITVLFSAEYALRIYCANDKLRYIRSFYGVIDLLAILPTFISLVFPFARSLMIIRVMRLLRVFRILKLDRFTRESREMIFALRGSGVKILVFIFAVLSIVSIFGTIMYLVEGAASGFNSIPRSIYWAIVTLTTVGYGDITPITPLGQTLAVIVMILGYGIIAVPTGIVSSEVTRRKLKAKDIDVSDLRLFVCPACKTTGHKKDAAFCFRCGEDIRPER
ncbi:MAG: ion transporter [Cryomorphaceae bacterium]|nr:MAG: ion transporter [Cryomorphaceae bacterium]